MNKLSTSIDNKFIFNLDFLSHHTKCILLKIVTDFIHSNEPTDFLYLEENIFGTWPEKVVFKALDELTSNDIMCIDMCDCGECEEENILFNPEFIDDVCPHIGCCQCCEETNVFNVIYN